jgi:tetratricopeptide (TPR) repeat protein
MRLDAARWEVGAGELVRGDELENVRIDLRPKRFDAIPNERVTPVLVAMEETDLKRHAFARERPCQASGFDHNAIIDHGGYRMRRVLVAEKFRTFVSLCEASPTRRQIAALAFDQSKIAMRAPVDARRFRFDHYDFCDAASFYQRRFASRYRSRHGGRDARPERALVYRNTRKFTEAEAAYTEAAGIQRDLVAHAPAFRPNLAQTLNDLGNLNIDTRHFPEAEAAYNEAVVIERDLEAQEPAAFGPDLAKTLDNLGNLYAGARRFTDAEAAHQEAAGIRRDLAGGPGSAARPSVPGDASR